jgi:predicted GNAT superfamily acetyltransferase
MSALAAAPAVEVRVLSRPEECACCEVVYREVFGLAPNDGSINARLLVSLARNSGMVIGAYAGGELVGFTLSFLARDGASGRLYQYSQTAAVRPEWQGQGIGRAMKFAQRSAALAAGIDLLRWTFDPLRPANAHFNLDVLGGVVTGLARDLYGAGAAPNDRGEPTDRFVVHWELASPAVRARAALSAGENLPAPRREPLALLAGQLRPGELQQAGTAAFLCVPSDWRQFRRSSPSLAARLRDQIIAQAEQLIDGGLVAVSCTRLDGDTAVYRFTEPPRTHAG